MSAGPLDPRPADPHPADPLAGGAAPSPEPALLAEPVAEASPDEVPGAPQSRCFLTAFIAAWFGLSLVGGTIGGASIPKLFAFLDDANKGTYLSIVAAIGGIAVIVTTPLWGRLSDRTMSRWGKRRANAAVHALLADQIPTRIRARVAAAASASGGIALIAGALLIAELPNDQQWTWFVVPGVIGTAFSLVLFFGLRDIVRTDRPAPWRWSDVLSTYWLSPRRYPDFFWAFWCRLLVTMSIVSVSTYLLFFIIDHLGVPKEEASGVQALTLIMFTIGNIAMTLLFGWISDATGRRKPIVWISCLLSAAGLIIAIIAPDITVFYIGIVIVGAAQGAFVSVDIALMTEVLPTFADAGKDLGIVSLSYQVPQLLVPITALPLLAIGGGENYTALYIAAIVYGVLGGLAVLPIRSVK